MLNKWMGIGRLTKDPELRYTTNGNATCSFTLACDRQFKGQDSSKETDFINVSIPPYKSKLAELVANYLSKGKLAYVEGPQQTRTYGEGDQKRWVTEIIGFEVKFLSPKDSGQSQSSTSSLGHEVNFDDGSDVPF